MSETKRRYGWVEIPVEIVDYQIPCGPGCRGRLTITNRREDLLGGCDFYYDCGVCGRHGRLERVKP